MAATARLTMFLSDLKSWFCQWVLVSLSLFLDHPRPALCPVPLVILILSYNLLFLWPLFLPLVLRYSTNIVDILDQNLLTCLSSSTSAPSSGLPHHLPPHSRSTSRHFTSQNSISPAHWPSSPITSVPWNKLPSSLLSRYCCLLHFFPPLLAVFVHHFSYSLDISCCILFHNVSLY